MEELQDPLSSIYPCLFGPGALAGEEKRNKMTGGDGDDHNDGGGRDGNEAVEHLTFFLDKTEHCSVNGGGGD